MSQNIRPNSSSDAISPRMRSLIFLHAGLREVGKPCAAYTNISRTTSPITTVRRKSCSVAAAAGSYPLHPFTICLSSLRALLHSRPVISDRKPAWFPTQAVRLWLLLTAALPLWAQMDNDNFANRLRLESRGGIPELTLLNASRELGEQGPVGAALGEVSVWLSWTPAQSGPARLFLLPAAGSPPWAPLPPSRVVVATGSALGSLTPVVRIDASGFTNFVAEAGREYVVGVVGINGGVFRAGVTPVPSNDEFSSAAVLTGNASSFLATTLGATASIFDPTTLQQKPTVWWHWTAPEAGTLTFQLSQPAGSMILQSFADQASSRQDRWLDGNGLLRASQVTAGESVFFGVAGEITEENLAPVHLTLSSLRLEIGGGPAGLQKGVPATIALEDRPEGVRFVRAGLGNVDSPLREAAGDDLTLVWTPEHSGQYSLRGFAVDEAGRIWTTRETLVSVRPANDDFADATILSTGASATEFSLAGATSEAGEPEPLEPTVWFSWTAAETGLAGVSVSRRASLAGLRVRILSGDTLGGLRLLAENGQTNNRAQRRLAIFPAEGGQRHWIVASGWLTGITPLQLQIVPQAELPLNDDFTNRLVLSGSELTVTNQMRFATLEPGEERINFHGNSVWHEWIAAAPGELALTATSGSNTFPSVMAYWQGDFPPVRLPDLSSGPSIRLLVMPGTNYFIGQTAWALSPAQLGTTLLNLKFQPAAFNDLFANRQVEAGTEVPFEGTTAAAGFEPGEAPPRLRTVWHTWTAPRSGDVMVWPITPAELRIYVFRGGNTAKSGAHWWWADPALSGAAAAGHRRTDLPVRLRHASRPARRPVPGGTSLS